MAAVTDLPFRTVWEEFGVGFTITEFLSAHALAVGDPKTTGKLTASLDGRRFGVQIFERDGRRGRHAHHRVLDVNYIHPSCCLTSRCYHVASTGSHPSVLVSSS